MPARKRNDSKYTHGVEIKSRDAGEDAIGEDTFSSSPFNHYPLILLPSSSTYRTEMYKSMAMFFVLRRW